MRERTEPESTVTDKKIRYLAVLMTKYQGYIKKLVQDDLDKKEKADPRPDLKNPVHFLIMKIQKNKKRRLLIQRFFHFLYFFSIQGRLWNLFP